MTTLKSPCIKICEMDYNIELCSGCFRTLDEIGSWTTMSDNEKLKIIKELEFRKNFHKNSNG
jgi:predicted Fe-S protein YdhL (DUF1289 family)